MPKIPFEKTAGKADVPGRLRALNLKQLHAVLATDSGGHPYTSLVAFALTPDIRGVIFATPKKTSKYMNLLRNSNVSLMIDSRSNTAKGYMNAEAVTILGTAVPLRKGRKRNESAAVLINKHPQLADFVNAPSTALIYIEINKVIHAGRFQSVTEWEAR